MAVHDWRNRFDRRAVPVGLVAGFGTSLAGFIIGVAVLVFLSPARGPFHSIELAPGALALRTAGTDPLIVVASIGTGMMRLPLTGLPTVLLAVGGLVGAFGSGKRWPMTISALCGVAAAGTLPVLWGCSCGSGVTVPLWRAAFSALTDGSMGIGILG